MNNMGNSNSLKKSEISVEIVIDYFEDNLNAEDQDAIEKLISSDADFADWVDAVYEGWLENPDNYLMELKQFKASFFNKIENSPPKLTSTSFILRLAATVLIIALVGIGVWNLFPSHTCEIGDFKCHIAHSEGVYQESITSAGSDEVEKNIRDFISAYKYEKYEEAILFADLINEDSLNLSTSLHEELLLCLGISYLHSSELEQATSTLNKLLTEVSDHKSIFKYEAIWYLSLAYLKMEDFEKAKTTLAGLVQEPSIYSHHRLYAQELLKRL